MKKITDIKALEVLDSRGNPTVCAQVTLDDGARGVAIAPSGASTGAYEAIELRDKDNSRFCGKGVKKAVENINGPISKALIGLETVEQHIADSIMLELDGTENKENLGANSILAVSMALSRAAAESYKMPLFRYLGGISARKTPIPMMNILNGGAHASNNVDIQEFMIVPKGAESFSEALRIGSEIYHCLGKILSEKGMSTGVGDEGGFAPNISSDREALELICEAIHTAGYDENTVSLALDVASSEWYQDEKYFMPKREKYLNSDEIITIMEELVNDFPIISIEDPLAEDDWEGWCNITGRLGSKVRLVGDDLFVTNQRRLRKGIKLGAGNSILIKPNQIGTVSETLEVIELGKKNGYTPIISHRSGESEDTFIADLAVAVGANYIKSGAPCRSERTAKYNRLLAIENSLIF